MGCWDTTPRLAFMSPEKESGKSKALETSSLFVSNPELFLNASPAALVRVVSQGHTDGNIPTILHDEIDNIFRANNGADPNNATLLAVFNQGYTPGASVPRCVGQGTNYTVVRMPCYCPVAFAGLGKLPDTLVPFHTPAVAALADRGSGPQHADAICPASWTAPYSHLIFKVARLAVGYVRDPGLAHEAARATSPLPTLQRLRQRRH